MIESGRGERNRFSVEVKSSEILVEVVGQKLQVVSGRDAEGLLG